MTKNLKGIAKQMNRAIANNKDGGVCTFGIITKDKVYNPKSHACHASLNGLISYKNQYVYNMIYECTNKRIPKSVVKSFIHWMINESPYKEVFIKKFKNCVLVDPTKDATLIASALIGLRIINEHTVILETWWQLVKAGVDKTIAFPIAHSFSITDGIVHTNTINWHSSFSSDYIDSKYVCNFYNGKYHKKGNMLDGKYSEVHRLFLFNNAGGSKLQKLLTTNLKHKKIKSNNPFNNIDKDVILWSQVKGQIVDRINTNIMEKL